MADQAAEMSLLAVRLQGLQQPLAEGLLSQRAVAKPPAAALTQQAVLVVAEQMPELGRVIAMIAGPLLDEPPLAAPWCLDCHAGRAGGIATGLRSEERRVGKECRRRMNEYQKLGK